MEDEEVFSCWFDEEDYLMIKKRIKLAVMLMESGKAAEGLDHTDRGLECRTAVGARERYRNRRKAVNAVLDEQDRQWDDNVDDDDQIAKLYLSHSAKSRVSAIIRGRQDQEFVKAHLRALRRARLSAANNKNKVNASQPRREGEGRGVDQPPQPPASQQ